jgi:hypothetical protein
MTAAQMAEIMDREWNADVESLEGFALRRFANEKATTFVAAVELFGEIVKADEDFDAISAVFGGAK